MHVGGRLLITTILFLALPLISCSHTKNHGLKNGPSEGLDDIGFCTSVIWLVSVCILSSQWDCTQLHEDFNQYLPFSNYFGFFPDKGGYKNNMKGMEKEDEEFEMLLGEIPRATSPPQHLEGLLKSNGSPQGEFNFVLPRKDAQKSSSGEAYEDFYQDLREIKNHSASITGGNVVSVSPSFSGSLPQFYCRLPLNGSCDGSSPQPQLDHISQSQGAASQQNNMTQEKQPCNGSIYHNGVMLSTEQVFPNQSLTATFANLSFKEDMAMRQVVQTSVQNGDGGLGSPVLEDGRGANCSAEVYSDFDVMGMSVPGHFNGNGNLNCPNSPNVSSPLNMYGINYPYHLRNLNGGFQATVNEMPSAAQAEAIKKLFKQNVYRVNTHGNNLGLPFDNFAAGSSDPQLPLPIYPVPPLPPRMSYQVLPHPCMPGSEILTPIPASRQQYYVDSHIGSYVQPQQHGPPVSALQQQINRMQMTWQPIEEERQRRMQQQYILLQQVQAQTQALSGMPNQVGPVIMGDSFNRGIGQQGIQASSAICPQLEQPFCNHRQQGPPVTEGDWSTQLVPGMTAPSSLKEFPIPSGNACRSYVQGSCTRGDCSFSHGQMPAISSGRISQSASTSFRDPQMVDILDREEKQAFPEKILTRNRSRGVNSITTINPAPAAGRKKGTVSNGHACGRAFPNRHNSSSLHTGSFQLDIQGYCRGVPSENTESEFPSRMLTSSQQQQLEYTTLEEVKGRIYFIAKDQHGCRFLQRKFDEGNPEDVQKIFLEIIDHIIELMTDPFGNYLVQKFLEVCSEDQRMQIIHAVTGKPGELVNISLNMHGTRAVQKLIETLETPQQVSMVISSLKPGVVALIKDLNGNHVVQRCLQCLGSEDSQFLFDAAAAHCIEIATHRHGCCVLQRCVDYSTGVHRQRLVAVIAANALVLSQDPFGNYVVQYILDLEIPWATVDVMVQLESNYAYLSMQKFSSNVVEKCLKLSGEENRAHIIRELINSSRLGQLLQDPYANYVVQSALAVSKGALHADLVEAIRPNLPALRSSPFGKRILSRTNLKK